MFSWGSFMMEKGAAHYDIEAIHQSQNEIKLISFRADKMHLSFSSSSLVGQQTFISNSLPLHCASVLTTLLFHVILTPVCLTTI
jgi:hypothetical protein